jgi:hypothetical protein
MQGRERGRDKGGSGRTRKKKIIFRARATYFMPNGVKNFGRARIVNSGKVRISHQAIGDLSGISRNKIDNSIGNSCLIENQKMWTSNKN